MSDAIEAGPAAADVPACTDCGETLRIELGILEPRDVALLHVCSQHGAAAISRRFT